VECYLLGFYHSSPAQVYLSVILGLTNEGSYVNFEHGQAWGNLIDDIDEWIRIEPSYTDKVGILGGIDNELAWNAAAESLEWRSGYIYATEITYIYYGDCDSCPFTGHTDWTPEPLGWTLSQVDLMASGEGSIAMPLIYRKDGQHAYQKVSI
jgi:hypothetical protein